MSDDISEICSRLSDYFKQSIKNVDILNDRLDKIEARLNEVPKEQVNEVITRLIKNLQSPAV